MKWIEPEFIAGGRSFSIMDLELYLNREELMQLLKSLDDKTSTVVNYHLHFDFFFMAGVFPGIASICMLARERVERKLIRSALFSIALLQLIAWGCDIYENTHLIKWLKDPSSINNFELYHVLVRLKFIIAFTGIILVGISFLFFRKKLAIQNQS